MKYKLIKTGTTCKIQNPMGEIITTAQAMIEISNSILEIKKALNNSKK